MSRFLKKWLVLFFLLIPSGCAPAPSPAPFRPPTSLPLPTPLPTLTALAQTFIPAATSTSQPTPAGDCLNDLAFLQDVTLPDNQVVLPNSVLDKQWLVQNTGACNWDETYRLKWLGGNPLGAQQEQPLYPARAGTQATLRILFLAPSTPGTYESSWQAVAPGGDLFGDPIYVKIAVGE